MGQLQSHGPMDLVCVDFLCLEPDTSGQGNVLVVTDHFTCYAQAFPTKDQRANTVAKILVEKYTGLPQGIHSDQGRDFKSKLVKQLLDILDTQKLGTIPYRPQGDPQPERFNRNLLDMFGTLTAKKKQHWTFLLLHMHITAWKMMLLGTLYPLIFGRETQLPVDIVSGISMKPHSLHTATMWTVEEESEEGI